jgi:hypothetical protein
MPRILGTISPAEMFGYQSPRVTQPQASAAASGLTESQTLPAIWFVGLIGALFLLRLVWERAK